MRAFPITRREILLLAIGVAMAVASVTQATRLYLGRSLDHMFLAPMIGIVETCLTAQSPVSGVPDDDLVPTCTGPAGSASALVESTLSALAAPGLPRRGYELGYTLPVPLLKLFRPSGNDWTIDGDALGRVVRTIRDTSRPVVVYLFSTHFAVNAPIEEALAADPLNLSVTPAGPLSRDKYYGTDIYNWTFAGTDNPITRRRVQATQAVLSEICKLEPRQLAKIRGVSLLGELHHLFPGFQGGMGFDMPYLVSDYSEVSKAGFREYLRAEYGDIDRLNAALGTHWIEFHQIEPPSKDIRTMPLRDFSEHIDSFAHGSVPVAGWAYLEPTASSPRNVRIYLNGELAGTTGVTLGRQDVLQAMPELGDANTGWRFNLDFRALPAGLHRIDVLLEDGPGPMIHLATRQVAIMDRQQHSPRPMPQKPLPPSREPGPSFKGHVDLPVNESSYYYNPLVPLWHDFRGRQVVDYLEYFGAVVKTSCLADTKLYTHQIVPFTNPGWDENKFAIHASLQPLRDIGLGVSLYGEPTYGNSFMQWLSTSGHRAYGVTEFHPLRAMEPVELRKVLDAHAARGAKFVSFFLEPRWNGRLVARQHNIFSLDPENPEFGSAQLYRAVAGTLSR
jgi:hypothetical protein